MKRQRWARTVVPLAMLAVAAAAYALVWAAPAAAQSSPAAVQSRWGANYFPNVALTTQDGEVVHFYDLIKGKIVAIDLIYTTCEYNCPLETARLAQVQRLLGDRMGRDIFFYSITIDPEHDTPQVLKAYAEQYGAGPGWLFLNAKLDDVDLISKKLGLYSEPNADNKDGHMPTLLIGNEDTGQWMRGSALDNPKFTAALIGNWMNSWTTAKPGTSYAEAVPIKLSGKGEYLFSTKCVACHSIGGGDKIGPDLAGVTAARDRGWLTRYIAGPDRMRDDPDVKALFEKFNNVKMPNLNISEDEADDILGFVDAHTATHR
jgi:protein SCO1/2